MARNKLANLIKNVAFFTMMRNIIRSIDTRYRRSESIATDPNRSAIGCTLLVD
jgi:hypothetical protein